jgi:DNA invertase Pin-like site-specific DNA recombinase
MAEKPKAYSYIRFSSPEQAKGDSYRRQREAALAYCQEQGLELAATSEYTFFDRGRSAFTGKHTDDTGELGRFLKLVENGAIPKGSYLIVESLDRLSREEVRKALPRFLDLLGKGICIYTSIDKHLYTENYDLSDLVISIVSMSRAHEESAHKGNRVSEAWQNKRNLARTQKKPLGNACPYWLQLVNGAYQKRPDRVLVIERIFEMCLQGYGQMTIAKRLNEDGVAVFGSVSGEKPRNKSGAWGSSSVGKILDNRAVLGEYQPMSQMNRSRINDGEPVEGFYPPIIEPDVFLRAKAARVQRQTSGATKQSSNFNIWQGIAKCHLCGDAMHLINKGRAPKGYTYLQCFLAKKGRCHNGSIRIEQTEAVFKEILTKVDSLALVQGQSAEILASLEVAEGKLAELATKLERTTEAFNKSQSTTVAQFLRTIEKEHEHYQAERDALRQQLAASQITSKGDFFNRLDLVSFEGRAAANSLLKRLGIKVRFRRFVPNNFQCWVLDHSDEVESGNNGRMLVSYQYTDGAINQQALDEDVWAKQIQQGERTPTEVVREHEEGIGWQWFGGKLRSTP